MNNRKILDNMYNGVKDALYVIYEIARWTPLNISTNLSRMVGAEVYLKLENMQRTGSFKLRGAYYAIKRITSDEIVTASDGNHAQGAALASSILNKRLLCVMPEYTSHVKINAAMDYGASIEIFGKTYEEAIEKAMSIASARGLPFLHPYDNADIIAGNGTIGYEVLNDLSDVSTIIVPVGGGGLIAGIAAYIKKKAPNVKIIGVEPKASPSMKKSVEAGNIVKLQPKPTIAEGIAMASPGEIPFKIVNEAVDDIIVVDDDDIAYAIYILMERVKTVAEPAGAASVAALLSGKIAVTGKVVAIISGGNIDAPLLSKVILEGMGKTGRIMRLEVALVDKPGELDRFLSMLTQRRTNIIYITVDYTAKALSPSYSKVILLAEVFSREDKDSLISEMRRAGYNVISYE